MEIRANYTLIGAFTLLSLFGVIFFTLWLAKLDQAETNQYDIYFEEKVSGLALNSEVLFNGIRVGTVTSLKLSHEHPGSVKARITIAADTPVRQDSEATLENKGLTGLVLISIAGGSAEAPLNIPPSGAVGNIKYRPSPFATVLADFPNTIQSANQLLVQLQGFASQENQQKVSTMLNELATVTQVLASRADAIGNIIDNAEKTTNELQAMASSINTLVRRDGESAVKSLSQTAKNIEKLVKTMEPGLNEFVKNGLPELRMFLVEARSFVRVYSRIGQKLESNPRLFFFGDPVQEYEAP